MSLLFITILVLKFILLILLLHLPQILLDYKDIDSIVINICSEFEVILVSSYPRVLTDVIPNGVCGYLLHQTAFHSIIVRLEISGQ